MLDPSAEERHRKDRDNGFTPLMDAAWYGNIPEINRLVTAGARVNSRSRYGSTALFWAIHNDKQASVEALLKAGADCMVINHEGHNPETWALSLGHIELANFLHQAMIAQLLRYLHEACPLGEVYLVIERQKAHRISKSSIVDYLLDQPLPRAEKLKLLNFAIAVNKDGKPSNSLSKFMHQSQGWGVKKVLGFQNSYAVLRLSIEIQKISLFDIDTSPKLR